MKKTTQTVLFALLCLSGSAQAAQVQGYFIPDSLETKIRGHLAYIVQNAANATAGAAVLRGREIAALETIVNEEMNIAERAIADYGYDVTANLAKAKKLNAGGVAERKQLKELAQEYLAK